MPAIHYFGDYTPRIEGCLVHDDHRRGTWDDPKAALASERYPRLLCRIESAIERARTSDPDTDMPGWREAIRNLKDIYEDIRECEEHLRFWIPEDETFPEIVFP